MPSDLPADRQAFLCAQELFVKEAFIHLDNCRPALPAGRRADPPKVEISHKDYVRRNCLSRKPEVISTTVGRPCGHVNGSLH